MYCRTMFADLWPVCCMMARSDTPVLQLFFAPGAEPVPRGALRECMIASRESRKEWRQRL